MPSAGSDPQVLLHKASGPLVVATAANLTGHTYPVNTVDELVAPVLIMQWVLFEAMHL